MTEAEQLALITKAFFAYSQRRLEAVTPAHRFAHYTSADTAMKIISRDGQSLWLRQASEMNDFSEVQYGQHCLRTALMDEDLRDRFNAAFDAINPELLGPIVAEIDAEALDLKANTFLTSLALHTGRELEMGKLSMWRAYGGRANVCLIFNTPAFMNEQDVYDVSIIPVDYGGEASFKAELELMVERLVQFRDQLKLVPLPLLRVNLKLLMEFAVLSSKHPAFEEETEWRLIYRPSANRPMLPRKIVSIEGIVQPVFMIPMKNVHVEGGNSVTNATLDEILFRIIIGPTPNPDLVRWGFIHALEEAGVSNAQERVVASYIPLRR